MSQWVKKWTLRMDLGKRSISGTGQVKPEETLMIKEFPVEMQVEPTFSMSTDLEWKNVSSIPNFSLTVSEAVYQKLKLGLSQSGVFLQDNLRVQIRGPAFNNVHSMIWDINQLQLGIASMAGLTEPLIFLDRLEERYIIYTSPIAENVTFENWEPLFKLQPTSLTCSN